jgi:hypothetical protein
MLVVGAGGAIVEARLGDQVDRILGHGGSSRSDGRLIARMLRSSKQSADYPARGRQRRAVTVETPKPNQGLVRGSDLRPQAARSCVRDGADPSWLCPEVNI